MRWVWAALGAMVVLGGVSAPANAEPMDAATLEATFSGMSLVGVYDDGAWFSEIYAPDGTISYVDAASGHFFGEWSVRGNTFCTFYDGIDGVCLTAEQTSGNCYAFAPPPAKGSVPEGGAVFGWNALEPSTCESIPAAATVEPAAPARTK